MKKFLCTAVFLIFLPSCLQTFYPCGIRSTTAKPDVVPVKIHNAYNVFGLGAPPKIDGFKRVYLKINTGWRKKLYAPLLIRRAAENKKLQKIVMRELKSLSKHVEQWGSDGGNLAEMMLSHLRIAVKHSKLRLSRLKKHSVKGDHQAIGLAAAWLYLKRRVKKCNDTIEDIQTCEGLGTWFMLRLDEQIQRLQLITAIEECEDRDFMFNFTISFKSSLEIGTLVPPSGFFNLENGKLFWVRKVKVSREIRRFTGQKFIYIKRNVIIYFNSVSSYFSILKSKDNNPKPSHCWFSFRNFSHGCE